MVLWCGCRSEEHQEIGICLCPRPLLTNHERGRRWFEKNAQKKLVSLSLSLSRGEVYVRGVGIGSGGMWGRRGMEFWWSWWESDMRVGCVGVWVRWAVSVVVWSGGVHPKHVDFRRAAAWRVGALYVMAACAVVEVR